MRSAESARRSSCAFADRIGALCLAHYRSVCPNELQRSYNQTVLAAVVLQVPVSILGAAVPPQNGDDGDENCTQLIVVSLGVGTKVVGAKDIELERLKHGSNFGDRIVRDQHAEVLARRGFMRFLYEQLLQYARGRDTQDFPLFVSCVDSSSGAAKLKFNPVVKVHLYTSSQPCGNACIKKWAKSSQPTYRRDLTADQLPDEEHTRFYPTAVKDGQVALLVKTNYSDRDHVEQVRADYIPAGTAPLNSRLGNVMTCSDKIARWNALGLQGALLSCILTEPIYLASITIGRKFSRVHCERALCCRLQDFSSPSLTFGLVGYRQYATCHPVMLGTQLKFDEGSIVTHGTSEGNEVVVGAQFSEFRTMVGVRKSNTFAQSELGKSEGCAGARNMDNLAAYDGIAESSSFYIDILDGRSGFLYQDEENCMSSLDAGRESIVSSATFFNLFNQIGSCCPWLNLPDWRGSSYENCKLLNGMYAAARRHLLAEHEFFGEWITVKYQHDTV